MATFHDLTTTQLKQAVQIREQIESLQEKLNALLGGAGPVGKAKQNPDQPKGRRKMSAATIEKMRSAQQARWAKVKSPADEPMKIVAKKSVPSTAAPKKRTVSPETKAKLAAAMKARWAAKKAAQ